jgi:transposase
MDVINPCCAGLDVHKETVVACVRTTGDKGRVDQQVRTFPATTAGLLALGDWLAERGATAAAMESTGVYWKPVWNLLEGRLSLMLVNAREVRQLPGRKTDVNDSQWLAQLLSCGLLRPSFAT